MLSVPRLVARLQIETSNVVDYPENQLLFLPHFLNLEDLNHCSLGIAEIEVRLRDGQLRPSLKRLRVHLHIKMQMMDYKACNICH